VVEYESQNLIACVSWQINQCKLAVGNLSGQVQIYSGCEKNMKIREF